MSLFAANAVRGGMSLPAPAPDYRAAKPKSFLRGAVFGPLGFLKDVVQGAGAGALTFLGAMRLSADAAIETSSASAVTIGEIGARLMQGGAPGVMEFLAAGALFLSAGKGPGRVVGLLGLIAAVAAYANGAAPEEIVPYVESLYAQLSALMTEFGAGALLPQL